LGSFKTFAEVLDRFVDREPGPIGRDLKQDPARLAKIDGMKNIRDRITGVTARPNIDKFSRATANCSSSFGRGENAM